jgi:hypothetical protein
VETIKEPMHPSRLEKNANITLKSATAMSDNKIAVHHHQGEGNTEAWKA